MVKSYNGVALGSVTASELTQALRQHVSLPSSVTFTDGTTQIKTTPQALGITIDYDAMSQQALQRRSMPLLELMTQKTVDLALKIDETAYRATLLRLTKPLQKETLNANIIVKNGTFTIQPEQIGVSVNPALTKSNLQSALARNQSTIPLSTSHTPPAVIGASLQPAQKELEAQTNTAITITFQDKKITPTAADKTAWFAASGTTMGAAIAPIEAYLNALANTWNIQVNNMQAAAEAIQSAVGQKRAATIVLQGSVRTRVVTSYTFCVAAKEVDPALLQDLSRKLQSVLADARGWSLGGVVVFRQVDAGCQFTVWLSKASLLPTFSSGCSAEWSCRVGSNVIVNLDRWQNASTSWNAAGGSLDEYQAMVINHEIGHWLGFDHYQCSGPGQPAPVMLQQSIDLQACAFNAWPVVAETKALKTRLGL